MSKSARYKLKGFQWGQELIIGLFLSLYHSGLAHFKPKYVLKNTLEFKIQNVLFFAAQALS